MTPRLKELYNKEIKISLKTKFGYKIHIWCLKYKRLF